MLLDMNAYNNSFCRPVPYQNVIYTITYENKKCFFLPNKYWIRHEA
jgi:hypothetical protein